MPQMGRPSTWHPGTSWRGISLEQLLGVGAGGLPRERGRSGYLVLAQEPCVYRSKPCGVGAAPQKEAWVSRNIWAEMGAGLPPLLPTLTNTEVDTHWALGSDHLGSNPDWHTWLLCASVNPSIKWE